MKLAPGQRIRPGGGRVSRTGMMEDQGEKLLGEAKGKVRDELAPDNLSEVERSMRTVSVNMRVVDRVPKRGNARPSTSFKICISGHFSHQTL